MSDDWQVGDLALCVANGCFNTCPCGRSHMAQADLRAGQVAVVEAVTRRSSVGNCREQHLFVGGHPRLALRFRKINPLTPEEHEQAMTELLMGKPVKEVA